MAVEGKQVNQGDAVDGTDDEQGGGGRGGGGGGRGGGEMATKKDKKKKKNFIGKTYINRYHSTEKLGSGNFGTAFLVLDNKKDKEKVRLTFEQRPYAASVLSCMM